jgi:hypothetical protein
VQVQKFESVYNQSIWVLEGIVSFGYVPRLLKFCNDGIVVLNLGVEDPLSGYLVLCALFPQRPIFGLECLEYTLLKLLHQGKLTTSILPENKTKRLEAIGEQNLWHR